MAKVVGFRIEISGTDEQVRRLNEIDVELQKLNKDRKTLIDLAKTSNKNEEALSNQLAQVTKRQFELRQEKSKTTQAIKLQNNATNSLENAYDALVAETRIAKKEAQERGARYGTTSKEFREAAKSAGVLDNRLKKIDSSVGDNFRNVGNYNSALSGTRAAFGQLAIGIGAGVAAFQGITNAVSSSVEAFGEQERTQKALEVALGFTSERLLEQATALQNQTKFGDEAIIQSQALLAQFGLQEDQIASLTPALLDFAEAQGIGLEDAAKLLSKSLGSSTNALSRYGIEITGAVGSNERLDSAITALNEKFEGQAAAAAQVGTGPLTQLQNILGDIQEVIGGVIIRAITPLIQALSDTGKSLQEVGTQSNILKAFVNDIRIAFGRLTGQIDEANNKFSVLGTVINLIKVNFEILAVPFRIFFNAVGDLIELVGELTGEFEGLGGSLNGFIRVLNRLPQIVSVVADSVVNSFGSIGKAIRGAFTGDLDLIEEAFSDIRNTIVSIPDQIAEELRVKQTGNPFGLVDLLKNNANKQAVENAGVELCESSGEGAQQGFDNSNVDEAIARDFAKGFAEELSRELPKQLEAVEIEKTFVSLTEEADLKAAEQAIAARQMVKDATIDLFNQTADALFQAEQEQNERQTERLLAQLEIENEIKSQTIQDDADTENAILRNKLEQGLITEVEFEQQKEDIDANRRKQQLKQEQQALKRQQDIERAQFERTKRLQSAQAIINGALAITRILADTPKVDFGIATAVQIGIATATTAAQVATIRGQQFQKGGVLVGASHANGGIPFTVGGRSGFEAEGGEAIINKNSTGMFRDVLSDINVAGGGVPFQRGGVPNIGSNSRLATSIVDSVARRIKVENVSSETANVNRDILEVENLASA